MLSAQSPSGLDFKIEEPLNTLINFAYVTDPQLVRFIKGHFTPDWSYDKQSSSWDTVENATSFVTCIFFIYTQSNNNN